MKIIFEDGPDPHFLSFSAKPKSALFATDGAMIKVDRIQQVANSMQERAR